MTQHSRHQHQLPAGCHDANTASELLGISKKKLLKRMRELGWLMVGGDNQNLPRREYIQRGWLATQDRGYPLKGNPEITKTYRVMLLTQRGFQELKKLIDSDASGGQPQDDGGTPPPTDRRQATGADTRGKHELPATRPMTEAQRAAADAERKKALAQLEKWGLTG